VFLQEAGTELVFGGIRRLLAEQLGRSSVVEQQVLRVLAVTREPATLAELCADLAPHVGRGSVLEAVGALRRRSLLERVDAAGRVAFTVQSVVLEYVTDRLAETMTGEIERGRLLSEQPLMTAQAKDHVRQTQEALIGAAILQRLNAHHPDTEQRLLTLLGCWRGQPTAEQAYGPGNVVNLLRKLRGDLRGMDLSRLVLRQVYLQGVDAQDASLAGARLEGAVLDEAFAYPTAIGLSAEPSGASRFPATESSWPAVATRG
jgi:hypothetical protein